MTVVQGWDLALNHGAVVELEDGDLKDFFYWTTKAGAAAKSVDHGRRLILSKSKEKQARAIDRLCWIEEFLVTYALSRLPDYIGIEDYAIRAEQGAHYMGEVGGVARLLCWKHGIRFRLHDPISVKMFATHDGTAQKDSVERAVLKRWGSDFSKFNQPRAKPTKKNKSPKQNRDTSEDLADAFSIAKIVHAEVLLRSGNAVMSDFHEKEIKVFNRVTKTYPVNLLNREWIFNEEPRGIPHVPEKKTAKKKSEKNSGQRKSKVTMVQR